MCILYEENGQKLLVDRPTDKQQQSNMPPSNDHIILHNPHNVQFLENLLSNLRGAVRDKEIHVKPD